ncbi:hypothetical protein ONA22_06670 [Mycoplasmopsis cynos]|uniref:hypothetical protein n=1 Tax=Mycoplasmopsis cynos TaxID=171284 RepID=UPI0024CA1BE7|nr:hypothetical protein [Mycoplasmopsis cynos]WAM03357.1 hypothetical protein ONA22_06670 [Mycoplasmopsis cynos]
MHFLLHYQFIQAQAGAGNATDSLTYSLFEKQISKASVDDFLASIPTATAVKNAKSRGMDQCFYH